MEVFFGWTGLRFDDFDVSVDLIRFGGLLRLVIVILSETISDHQSTRKRAEIHIQSLDSWLTVKTIASAVIVDCLNFKPEDPFTR